jgi:hypothetical protein
MWRLLTAVLAGACTQAASPPSAVDLDEVRSWVGEHAVIDGERVRWVCPGDEGAVVHVTLREGPRVRLRTSGLMSISDGQDARQIMSLLTQLSTSAFDVSWGGLSLDPTRGEVVYRLDVPLHDGPAPLAVVAATESLCRETARVLPLLRRSVTLGPR